MTLDYDLRIIQETRDLARKAKEAQAILATFSQEKLNEIIKSMSDAVVANAEWLARMACDETKYGIYEHKIIKNTFAGKEVYEYIKSVSYPNNKAKHLVGMARKLISDFNGVMPQDVDELQKLPGVGRKTANVVASVAFNKEAMAVDTHVFRVSNRIGLTRNSKTPLETERTLVSHIPGHLLPIAHHWLILHGRYVCTARNPKCDACGLHDICVYFGKKKKD